MKHFLHWSSAAVCGVTATAIQQSYGWWAWAACMLGGLYVMCAQYYEGRLK